MTERFRIHFTDASGNDDSFVIEGDNINQLQEQASAGVKERNGTDPWSEELTAPQ